LQLNKEKYRSTIPLGVLIDTDGLIDDFGITGCCPGAEGKHLAALASCPLPPFTPKSAVAANAACRDPNAFSF
jgi:hypothetical protein